MEMVKTTLSGALLRVLVSLCVVKTSRASGSSVHGNREIPPIIQAGRCAWVV